MTTVLPNGRPSETVRRWAAPLLLLTLGGLLLLQQARGIVSFSSRYTDEDQTLLWLSGRELLDGHLRTPNFWGQNYLTIFETIPGQALHLLGVSLRFSDPIGTALIVTVAWLVIATAAWRRGAVTSAALALALPLILSVDYLLCFDQLSGVLSGDLLGAIAVAVVVLVRRPWLRLGLVVALTGLAFQWENASALATGPALAAAVTLDQRALRQNPLRTVAVVLVGLVPPATWFAYEHLWYSAHPGAVVQPSPPLGLSLSVLSHNLAHPSALFAFFAPELFKHPWVAEFGLATLILAAVGVGLRDRRLAPVAAAVAFAVVICAVLSTRDTGSNYEPNLYLAGSRFLLPMPFGAWLVAHLLRPPADRSSTPTQQSRRISPRHAVIVAAVLVAALASTAATQLRFDSHRSVLLSAEQPPNPIAVQVEPARDVLSSCAVAATLAKRDQLQVMVSADRTLAYGCGAESGLDTIYPVHDRRFWVIDAALTRPVSRLLLGGGYTCRPGHRSTAGRCEAAPDGFAILITPPRPILQTLNAMHIGLYRGLRRASASSANRRS